MYMTHTYECHYVVVTIHTWHTHMSVCHIWVSLHSGYHTYVTHTYECHYVLVAIHMWHTHMSVTHIWRLYIYDTYMWVWTYRPYKEKPPHNQPIPLGVTCSNAVLKLKAQSSNVPFAMFQWTEPFELWVLSFERALENLTPRGGIGCTSHQTYVTHIPQTVREWIQFVCEYMLLLRATHIPQTVREWIQFVCEYMLLLAIDTDRSIFSEMCRTLFRDV